ncbi:MAG TPA: tetratricopeptide repeat protein, partial [Longilinea sp.]|nr:tetratricopeptide repeat protein [Longilinea sp.]
MSEDEPSVTLTKLLMPRRRSDLYTRSRLMDALYEFIDHRITIVAAPAGYGKTSLIVDFAHHTEWPFCWYTLDRADREPRRFLAHLITSIAQQYPNFGKRSLAALHSLSQTELNLDSMVAVIVNEAYQSINEHFVIVLDDYHYVDDCEPVGYLLSQIIQEMDDNCHLIIISRTLISLPDLPLLVSRGQVNGLGMEDLAFRPDELQKLIYQNQKKEIPLSEATDLSHQTNGWITGLLLSTELMDKKGLAYSLQKQRATGIGLYDFLAEQVYFQQSPGLRHFLLRTSLFEEFNVRLCRDILGKAVGISDNWQALWDELIRHKLFVLPVGEDETWLRYHNLWQEFLQQRLLQELPEEAALIARALEQFYIERNEWERVYDLYSRFGEPGDLEKYITEYGSRLLTSGYLTTLGHWLDVLPIKTLNRNAKLLSLKGSVMVMLGNARPSLEYLNQAVYQISPQDPPELLVDVLVRRASTRQMLGEYKQALEDSDRALALMPGLANVEVLEAEAHRARGLALYRMGQLADALSAFTTSHQLYQELQEDQRMAILWMEIGNVHKSQGDFPSAEHSYMKAVDYWQRTNNIIWLANVLNNLGDMQRMMGEYEKAIHNLEKAVEYARMGGYLRLEAFSLASIADLYNDLGAGVQAMDAYTQAQTIAERIQDTFLLIAINLAEAVLSHRNGNTFQARRSIENARRLAEKNHSEYEMNLVKMEQARILLAEGLYNEGVDQLLPTVNFFHDQGYNLEETRAQLYLAAFRLAQGGDHRADMEKLSDLLTRVNPLIALLPTVQELRLYLKSLEQDPKYRSMIQYLFQEFDQLEQNQAALRRQLRRKVVAVPFAPPHLLIQALGKMQVTLNDKVITGGDWQAQTARDLFFFLLAHPSGVTKEVVGEAFWPGCTQSEMKMRFKNVIYRLRRAVGKDVVLF